MALKISDLQVSNIVHGFGTADTVEGFTTVPFGSGITYNGTPYRMTPRNATFMPYSYFSVSGFSVEGSPVLEGTDFAAMGRFIKSPVAKITKTGNSASKVGIYYRGSSSPFKNGVLYIGGTNDANIVSYHCPPVIMVAIQAAGGNGGAAQRVTDWLGGWVQGSGGGGASGGFTCFQMMLPHNATTPTLVGQYIMNNSVSFFAPGATSAFAVMNAGGAGANGTARIENYVVYMSGYKEGGNGGDVPSNSQTSLPTGFRNANHYQAEGGRYTFINGRSGGKGGTDSYLYTGSNYYAAAGGDQSGIAVFVNNASGGSSFTGGAGGAGGESAGGRGGGGGGSMYGAGGRSDSPNAKGNGAGGAGGYTAGGGTGGSACVRIYW